MEKFKYLEHISDVIFEAYGDSLSQAFENAALAMFEVICDTSKVSPLIRKEFTIEAEDKKSLLYDFLEELLFLHETQDLLFSKFEVKFLNGNRLHCIARGEKIKENKHELRTVIKAVTYHEMEIGKKNGKYFVRVLVDI